MVPTEEHEEINPICPHCKKEILRVFFRELATILGKRYIYFCPDCHAVLGVSHRKGFWMG